MERAKGWLKTNGIWIIAGIAIGAGGLGAWNWYQERRNAQAETASARYEEMVDAFTRNDKARGMTLLDQLNREYAWTPYASLGTLIAARVQVEANELDKAAASLKSVMDNAKDDELKMVARLRLARVQAAQGKYDDALGTLKVENGGEFAPRLADTRGDVLLAKGDRAGALKEYLAARSRRRQRPHRFRTARPENPRPGRHAAGIARGVLMKPMKPQPLSCVAALLGLRRVRFEGQEGRQTSRAHRHQATHRTHPESLERKRGWRRQEAASRPGPRHRRQQAVSRRAATAMIAAFDLKTGKQLWRIETKLELSGGTGVGADIVVVGSADGQVLAYAADNGAQRWQASVKGEILSAPAVADNEVIVRTVDGKLRALAMADGKEIWSAEQQIPRLTLRGTAAPVVARDLAISGFDNGRVLAVSLADGATVWDSPVSPAHGRTELERLNDIDAAVKVLGEEVFVAGFQGRAAMLALDSGQVWWTRDVSSYRGVDVDDEQMYVSTSQGELVALKRRTGAEVWRNALAASCAACRRRRWSATTSWSRISKATCTGSIGRPARSPAAPRPAATASPMRRCRSKATST